MSAHPVTTETSEPAALPAPSPLELLTAELAALREEHATTTAARDRLGLELQALREQHERLQAHLATLEKNELLLVLNTLDAGAVLAEAGGAIRLLSAEVLKRQEKGTVTLKIAVKPFKGDSLVLDGAVDVRPPKAKPEKSVFYATEEGALSRENPRQKEFGFGK